MNDKYSVVNLPDPHGGRDRIVGYRIPEGSEAYGESGLSGPLSWFAKKMENKGIRNHAGQTLLIEHVLLTDKTMNQNTRDILTNLIGSVPVSEYNGPKNLFELSAWQANRMPFKTERVGQAFFNDFGFQTESSYYCEDPYEAFSQIQDALAEKFGYFYGGL